MTRRASLAWIVALLATMVPGTVGAQGAAIRVEIDCPVLPYHNTMPLPTPDGAQPYQTVRIWNETPRPLVVESLGSLVAPLPQEPFRPAAVVPADDLVIYGFGLNPGAKAGMRFLLNQGIFDPSRDDGVRVVTSLGSLEVRCRQRSAALQIAAQAPTGLPRTGGLPAIWVPSAGLVLFGVGLALARTRPER